MGYRIMSKSREVRVPGCLVGLSSGFAGSCPIDTGGEIPLPNGDTLIMEPKMAEFDYYGILVQGIVFSLKSGGESLAYLYDREGKHMLNTSSGVFYDRSEDEFYADGISIHLYCLKEGSLYDNTDNISDFLNRDISGLSWETEGMLGLHFGVACYVITQQGGMWKLADDDRCDCWYGGNISLPNGEVVALSPLGIVINSEYVAQHPNADREYGIRVSTLSGRQCACFLHKPSGYTCHSALGTLFTDTNSSPNDFFESGTIINVWFSNSDFYDFYGGGTNDLYSSHNILNESLLENLLGKEEGLFRYTISQTTGCWLRGIPPKYMPSGTSKILLGNGEVVSLTGPVELSEEYESGNTGIYFTRSSGNESIAFYQGAGGNLGYQQETGYNYFGELYSCSEGDTIYIYDIAEGVDIYSIKDLNDRYEKLGDINFIHAHIPLLCTLRMEGGKWILAEDNSI